MTNDFDTIATTDLETITGGGKAQAIWKGTKAAAGWAWRNVIAPAGGGALYDWASQRFGGGQQPQQPPAQNGQ